MVNSFKSNKFEILMDQLQTTCPPGFLTAEGQNNDGNIPSPICFEKSLSSPKAYQRFPSPTQDLVGQQPASPRAYRVPISPRTPSFERNRSRTNQYDLAGQRPSSPRAYRPPISPRTPSFERNCSFTNQPRSYSRRLYVFNIPKDVTEQQLREFFSEYGTLTSCGFETEENYHQDTKYGFIAFEKSSTTDYVLENAKLLKLNGHEIRIKKATSQKTQLFVGGYDLYATKTDLIGFFSKYGEVCDFVMKYNSEGANRCFGFVTFRDSEDAVNKLVEERFLECMGKPVEIKRAAKTKHSFTSYGGTQMRKRNSGSSRFSRDFLELGDTPPLSPRSSNLVMMRRKSSSSSHECDVPIDGTRMYSRKFFAPTRPGMSESKSND